MTRLDARVFQRKGSRIPRSQWEALSEAQALRGLGGMVLLESFSCSERDSVWGTGAGGWGAGSCPQGSHPGPFKG